MKKPKLKRIQQIHGSMTLTLLQSNCLKAGLEYVRLTRESCALLVQFKEAPIPESIRNEVFSHRRRELDAHAAYSRARSLLWDFLTSRKPDGNDDDVMSTSENQEVNLKRSERNGRNEQRK